jgi:hypothetical protein
MADHPEEWIWTEIHIQKVKEYETGGQRTFKNEPVKLRMSTGGYGFVDMNGFNPIQDYHQKHTKDIEISFAPNTDFLTEHRPLVDPVVHYDKNSFYAQSLREEEDPPF